MSLSINPNLLREVEKFGAVDIKACYSCGNCTATCPLSEEGVPLPRRVIRYLLIGAEDRILGSLDPWLCYYCGECTQTCPRQADPGEAMMSLRRYLTSRYDWTGLSRRYYMSIWWEIASLVAVALAVVALFYFVHGPIVTDRVELLTFAPVHWVEIGDWILAAALSSVLGISILRFYLFAMRAEPRVRVPLRLYITKAPLLAIHFLTQIRFAKCENKRHWINHWILMSGYSLMFLFIVVLLRWFQTDNIYPIYHPQRLLGYYAFCALAYGSVVSIIGRIRKRDPIHAHSHSTDWMFPILLLITSVTGILVHAFRYLQWPLPTYYMFVAHMACAVPMLVLEVPFSKWAHLAYRPLAVYIHALRTAAIAEAARQAAAEREEAAA